MPLGVIPVCGHYFHSDCIRAWFAENPSCPNCRCDAHMGMLNIMTFAELKHVQNKEKEKDDVPETTIQEIKKDSNKEDEVTASTLDEVPPIQSAWM